MADTINITRECGHCHAPKTITVSRTGYQAWDMGRGAFVQEAFPELSADDRELLVSGICGPCFDAIMGPEPDEDEGPGALIIVAGDPSDIEAFARAGGYAGAERPPSDPMRDDESTPVDHEHPCSPDANPGPAGVTLTDLGPGSLHEIQSRVLAGKTLQGEEATRGHLSAPHTDWPRCATVLPTITSPLFSTEPSLCNRPATLIAGFTTDYLDACGHHRCDDPMCPIEMIGSDPEIRAQALANVIPVCGMHLNKLRMDEDRFRRDVHPDLSAVFRLAVIGVESCIGTAAQVFDLRGAQ